MTDTLDLAAYRRRIDCTGTLRPDRATLAALIVAHANAIAFENVDPFSGRPVRLGLGAIQSKLVDGGRGGYCFEHNHLFGAVLQAIGFGVEHLIARVVWRQPEDAVTAETHMLLRVSAGGDHWLVDVGFGGMTPLGPLRWMPDVAQSTAIEDFRLRHACGMWRLQVALHGAWQTLYHFDLTPHPAIDYVVANHYVATHPDSRFVQHLIASRVDGRRRLTLRDRVFAVREPGQEPAHRTLHDGAEVCRVLGDAFGLRLPGPAALARRIDALPAEPGHAPPG